MQEEEDRLQKSMGKLVATGKKISDQNPDETDSSNDDIANVDPAVDFSSHDLIRNRIANPEILTSWLRPTRQTMILLWFLLMLLHPLVQQQKLNQAVCGV